MPERKPEWREAGNLSIIGVEPITNYNACVDFDENNKYVLVANKGCKQVIFGREK
jgi:hypothetical protein